MQRPTTPENVIRAQVVLDEHDVAPNGRFAVVVRRFVVGDRYRSHLWLLPLDGGRPVQLTSGTVRDTNPRVAPDGSAVAFKRAPAATRRPTAAADETARVFVLPIRPDGRPGRAWTINGPRQRSIGELAWAPDGRRLALAIDAGPPRFIVGDEPRGSTAPVARRISRIDWRWDEAGHLDRWAHLFVVDAKPSARPRQITRGDWGVSSIAWAPDGRSVAFVSDPRPDADITPRQSIWAVSIPDAADASKAGAAQPREVLALGGWAYAPAWSPDGRWLAAVGYVNESDRDDTSPGIVVGPADGSAPPWPLAPNLDRPIGSWVDTDLFGWIANSRVMPQWLDAGTIIAGVADRGRQLPYRFDIDPATGRPIGDPRPLVTSDIAAHSLALATDPDAPVDTRVTVVATHGSDPMDLIALSAEPARRDAPPPRPRTTIGSRWAAGFAWPEMRLAAAPGPGGPIDTWIASPAGAADAPLPSIVDVHGGPLGAWGKAPSIEVVLLCARGYRVILPNIRGSTSYGADWIRPELNDWGGVDAADVHAAIDHVVALGLADPDRLGVLGLSYGGFMVNWLLGTSDRFKAGVSEAGVTNQVGDWANSDSGPEFARMALMPAPTDPDGVARLWAQSPLAHVADIRTPLLMLQGEADQRCPPSDNEQLFVALRVLRRTVEYVLYPEESHVYQASGRPDRRIDRMTRMLDWFDRYVQGTPA